MNLIRNDKFESSLTRFRSNSIRLQKGNGLVRALKHSANVASVAVWIGKPVSDGKPSPAHG